MCTDGDQMPGSIAEALRMTRAGLDYLNSPAAAGLAASAAGEVLAALGVIGAKYTAAHAAFLRRFDAADAHDADGYGTSSAWLAARTQLSVKDAKAAVRRMRQLTERAGLEDALARGELSWSWAAEIIELTRKLPAELRGGTDQILLDAAARGATLADLRYLAACALQRWLSQHPDPDEDDGFDDRYIQVGTTFGGAACIRGNLTPECNAAVRAVLEALGKKAGPEDHRTEHQRFHDALQHGCELLIRAKMVPDRAGADTHVAVHIPLSQLRQMPGASAIEDAWIRGRLGEDGYLTGKDAETAACDALIVPVVTGRADLTVVDTMIALVLAAIDGGHRAAHLTGSTGDSGDSDCYGSDGRSSAEDPGSGGREKFTALSPEANAALRAARRLVRRAPPHAQERRRQDQRHRLRAALSVPPRRLHPPLGLADHPAPRRHHRGPRTPRADPAQPRTPHRPGWIALSTASGRFVTRATPGRGGQSRGGQSLGG